METLPIFLLVFIVSGSIHEFAHAWVATRLGDPTPTRLGRVTLNPMVHVDPLGLLVLGISSMRGYGFGWMRPVEVSPGEFTNPKRDMMLVAAAGPLSNLLQALVLVALAVALKVPVWEDSGAGLFFRIGIMLNATLCLFNLIPLMPLDGFQVILGLLPPNASIHYHNWSLRFGPLVLVGLFVFGGAVLGPILFFIQLGVIELVARSMGIA